MYCLPRLKAVSYTHLYMTGRSHTDPEVTPFALEVMEYMNKACNRWKEETNIGFSIYGSPIESTTYKFAKCLQKRFGIIEGVTDRSYITNSYHVNVSEEIDAFSKLKFESQFKACLLYTSHQDFLAKEGAGDGLRII